jgi:predicted phosphodiesterase
VLRCTKAIDSLIKTIKKRWRGAAVRVYVVRGNHGRIMCASSQSSLDAMVGDALTPSHDVVDGGLATVATVAGARIALIHRAEKAIQTDPTVVCVERPGERGLRGLALRGTPTLLKKIRARMRHYSADALVAGHWHCPAVWRDLDGRVMYVQNGSLCGGDEYSEQLGLYDEAAQAIIEIRDGAICDVGWVKW